MPLICPTVLAEDPHAYREQMARIQPFAERIQIDIADGEFAPNKTVAPIQVYWPEGVLADLHLMVKNPMQHLETVVSLQPNLVIVHAEAGGDIRGMILELQSVGIKAGVALLKESKPEDYDDVISLADHVLLFAGDLGHFGGTADMDVLKKIPDVRAFAATVELGWDGGVNNENTPLLVQAGIEVLNVGGFIQNADDPQKAYEQLVNLAVIKA
jgi:ribulose-phosphate 3-epimerase